MMNTPNIGKLLDSDQQRDAIHVAVAPVVAAEDLGTGQHIGLDALGAATAKTDCPIGIVDPFLAMGPSKGDRFYLFLYPNTVTSLRHEWTHPAFPSAQPAMPDRAFSEEWLKQYAAGMSPYDSPEHAFINLIRGLQTGKLFAHGSDLHGLYELDDADELKRHAECYLGIPINWDNFMFSCSC